MIPALLLLALAASPSAPAAAKAPPRPRVLGLSHVAFRVSDPVRARSFYETLLGHPVAAVPDGLRVAVSDRQFVAVRAGLNPVEDRLDHVALETDDVAAMRSYLASRGVDVPAAVGQDESGNPAFTVRDPEGWTVELVLHSPAGWPRSAPRLTAHPGVPLSRRILHAGILVGDLPAAIRFYGDVLGLTETWRGSRSGTELSWTNMKVPDGDDYLEFMLYGEIPAPDARGTAHHICLEVPDIEAARARLAERVSTAAYMRVLEARVGTNRKRQLNLFDADGTRVELMEPRTVDGEPVPPSTAPPPKRN
jgi:catechol 2,3-dioxygenase-like lactoylglutathione lyase family enzyme